jgi:hypothetical protein
MTQRNRAVHFSAGISFNSRNSLALLSASDEFSFLSSAAKRAE